MDAVEPLSVRGRCDRLVCRRRIMEGPRDHAGSYRGPWGDAGGDGGKLGRIAKGKMVCMRDEDETALAVLALVSRVSR